MTWAILSEPVETSDFDLSQIGEILYEFETPKIFTTINREKLFFWYESADDANLIRYLVAPLNRSRLDDLKQGRATVYDILAQPWIWIVDVENWPTIASAWFIDGISAIPEANKPKPYAPLYPELAPVLSYRVIGPEITAGNVPASVIAAALKKPTTALKKLLELTDAYPSGSGRPNEVFRRSYDLPAARFAFNSFEVSFAYPVETTRQQNLDIATGGDGIYASLGMVLNDALERMGRSNSDGYRELGSELLQILRELAPPAHGQIEETEISGALFQKPVRYQLTRGDRTNITTALESLKLPERRLETFVGRVGELDRDNFTFIFRDYDQQRQETKVSFSEDSFDDVLDIFNRDLRATLVARDSSANAIWDCVAIEAGERTISDRQLP